MEKGYPCCVANASTARADAIPQVADPRDTAFFGHPRGLSTLFFTEMWERFSYYGMRALLILFMTAAPAAGGLGFDTATAGAIYGLYTSMVYMTTLPGGWIADRLIGPQRAVLYGGILIACGHFSMAVPSLTTFYLGLLLIVIGTGLLKGNVSVIVGRLYAANDARRDAGYSIFYMGINLGAFIAPLVCGYLGQRVNWHLGFAAAGVGMVLGLIQYVVRAQVPRRRRAVPGDEPDRPTRSRASDAARLTWASAAAALVIGGSVWRCTRRRSGDADAGRRRRRLLPARPHGRVLRLAVSQLRMDAGRAQAAVCHRRALPRRRAVLVGVRAGRLDAEPVRRPQHPDVDARAGASRAPGSSR